jgi:hypothetical protein
MLSLSFSSGNTRLFLGHREMFNVCDGLLESWLKEMSDQGPCIDRGEGAEGRGGQVEQSPSQPDRYIWEQRERWRNHHRTGHRTAIPPYLYIIHIIYIYNTSQYLKLYT